MSKNLFLVIFKLTFHIIFGENITSKWEMQDLIQLDLHQFFSWSPNDTKDIKLDQELTLQNGYSGIEIDLAVNRSLINKTCLPTTCTICYGKKTINRYKRSTYFNQFLSMPCPFCSGSGLAYDKNCPLNYLQSETINLKFPSGTYPGYVLNIPNKGNEIYQNEKIITGSLIVTAKGISDLLCEVSSDFVSYKIIMTPREAFTGFYREDKLFNGKMLIVDRQDKLTLPGHEVRIKNSGFPKIISPSKNTELVLKFELEEEKTPEESNKQEETITITSQIDFDSWMGKTNAVKQDKMIRNFLNFLKQEETVIEGSSK